MMEQDKTTNLRYTFSNYANFSILGTGIIIFFFLLSIAYGFILIIFWEEFFLSNSLLATSALMTLFHFIYYLLRLIYDHLGLGDYRRRNKQEGYVMLKDLMERESGYYYQNANLVKKDQNEIIISLDRYEYRRFLFYTIPFIIYFSLIIFISILFGGGIFRIEGGLFSILEIVVLLLMLFSIIFQGKSLNKLDPQMNVNLMSKEVEITSQDIVEVAVKHGADQKSIRLNLEDLRYLQIELVKSLYHALTIPPDVVLANPKVIEDRTSRTGVTLMGFADKEFAVSLIDFLRNISLNVD